MTAESTVKAKKRTVLVIDDDPAMTSLLQLILAKLGYRSAIAHDGMDGLRQADKLLPDCILLDLAMPELDGFGFLVHRRKSRTVMEIPVIVLSSKNRSEDVRRAMALGAAGYVTKPVEAKKLAARLERFVPSAYTVPVQTAVSWRE